jgi:phenylpropionate dioxygenase-like ring-hydroxylating dioxygenase large terminal subunit
MDIAVRERPATVVADVRSERTLPGWTYGDPNFFAAEKEALFLRSSQLVCHVSEIEAPGDFATLNLLGERALVVRQEDGALRAFYNVCRHRAAAVLNGAGHCDGMIRCPYHGWTYRLDGSLRAVPGEAGFPPFDRADYGLKPIELEVFQGFVFVRFRGGGPSVAERLAPYAEEFAAYRFADLRPLGKHWNIEMQADWKNVIDNYLEGYHVPVGHPGLFRMFGANYEVETHETGVSRAIHWLRDKRSPVWSEGLYQSLLPVMEHLPEERRRAWAYYTMLPNFAFDVYADQISYFQVLPKAPGRCVLRGRAYGFPAADAGSEAGRRLRAVRWLNGRINSLVHKEDIKLVESVQVGLGSESYTSGLLSQKEVCLRQFHGMVRKAIPMANLPRPPRRDVPVAAE